MVPAVREPCRSPQQRWGMVAPSLFRSDSSSLCEEFDSSIPRAASTPMIATSALSPSSSAATKIRNTRVMRIQRNQREGR